MALTKVAGDILDPGLDIACIVTASAFDGPFRGGSGRDVTAGVGTFTQLDVNGPGDFTGIVTFSHTQDSTSASTGTIQVAGGIGIAKSVYIGGDLVVEGTTTTIDTTLKAVDRIEVADDSTNVAVAITQTGAGDILNLFDGTTEVLTVLDTGEVGIGTVLPSVKLQVYNGAIRSSNAGDTNFTELGTDGNIEIKRTGGNAYIDFADTTGNDADCRIQHVSDGFEFSTGGQGSRTTKFVIDSSGRVGIGTNDPSWGVSSGLIVGDGAGSRGMTIFSNSSNVGDLAFADATSGTARYRGLIRYDHDDNSMLFRTNSDKALLINSSGKVGIGTDDPDDLVHINTTSNVGGIRFGNAQNLNAGTIRSNWNSIDLIGDQNLTFQTNGDTRMKITNSGRVGIGTVSPGQELDIWSASPSIRLTDTDPYEAGAYGSISQSGPVLQLMADSGNTSGHGSIFFYCYNDDDAFNAYRIADNYHLWYTALDSNSEKLRLNNSGYLGIGTIPTAPLNVRNSTSTLGILTSTSDGANLDLWDNDTQSRIRTVDGRLHLYADLENDVANSSIRFFVDSTNEKLRITGAGISVTGEVAASQDYPNQRPSVDFNFVSVKKLDPRFTYRCTGSASYTDEFGKVVLVGDNTPRFDHDPTTRECKGLLIEESRTNYCRSSSDLSSLWAAGGGSYGLDNAITNPDGTVGAYHHTGSELYHTMDLSGASTDKIRVSMWVKERSGQSGNIDMQIYEQVSGSVLNIGGPSFNPATGVITTSTHSSDEVVYEYPNGWYRIAFTMTAQTANFTASSRLDLQNKEHYVWGIQVEVAQSSSTTFETSYIPTNGTTVTRGQGFAVIDGEELSDFYNPNASTVICQFDTSNWMTYNYQRYERVFCFGNLNNEDEAVEMFKSNTSDTELRWRIRSGGSNVLGAANSTYSPNPTPKFGFAWQLNDAGVCVDGGTVTGTSDSGIPMPSITQLSLGNSCIENNSGGHGYTGWIRRFTYYPIKVSDAQLVTLTS